MQDYLLKIIDTPGLLKPEQVSALFGNIENIYALNRCVSGPDMCHVLPVKSILGAGGALNVPGLRGCDMWAQGLISEGAERRFLPVQPYS